MTRVLCLTISLLFAAGVASAEQYWIAYEGNDFPENEGWVRYSSDPPAERWLEDGSFFIDSRADVLTTDNYTIYFDGGLDPEPGETFIMRWGLLVHQAFPWEDPGVYVISDELWAVAFIFAEGHVLSTHEANVYAYFEPGVFHEFELRSGDMRAYELYIDSALAIEGAFSESFFSACAGFGDNVRGGASLAQWDYFRFGVVPEPCTWLMALVALACVRVKSGQSPSQVGTSQVGTVTSLGSGQIGTGIKSGHASASSNRDRGTGGPLRSSCMFRANPYASRATADPDRGHHQHRR